MIHINLLPVKANRKQEAGRQQLILIAAALAVAIGGNWYAYQVRSNEQDRLQAAIAKERAEIAALDKVIQEVKDITTKEEEYKTKLDALKTLESHRAGPVKILDAMQTAVPKKVWLGAVTEKGGAMKVNGFALSGDDLAEFMSGLQNVVDTPQGIGRLVNSGEASKRSRVELSTGEIHEFSTTEVVPFFTGVSLVNLAEATDQGFKIVKFELTLSANYSA